MKKLLHGIVEFRRLRRSDYLSKFSALAAGQRPDTLMIACSDSRVAPNVFASTNPGDLFVVRNVGNMIPPCNADGTSTADESEAAALEFSLNVLPVRDIIVCGHSECGAMHALMNGRSQVQAPNLRAWLRHGEKSLEKMALDSSGAQTLSGPNRLSQLNTLAQIEHLKTYPPVAKRLKSGELRLHAWWFDLASADVYAFEEGAGGAGHFVLIDETEATRILNRLN